MAGSEEYNKLFYRRPTIIKALAAERCTVDLAGRLQIRGLISDDVYSQATNYALVDSERLRIILEAVLAKVDLNPQRYDEFIDVLQEIGALEDLVSIIEAPLPKRVRQGPRPVKEPTPTSDQEQEPAPRRDTEMNKGSSKVVWCFIPLCVVVIAVVVVVIVKYWPPNVPPEKQPGIQDDKEPIWTQPVTPAKELPLKQGPDTQKDGIPPFSGKPAEGFSTSFLSKRPTMKELQLIKWDGKEKLMLIETIAAHWRKLGTTLGIPEQVLNGYATKHMKDQEECCREVLQRWRERGSEPKESYPVNWEGLINAIEDTGLGVIADDMRQMISYTKNDFESVQPTNKPITKVPETNHATTTRLSAKDFAKFPEPTLLQLNRFLGAEVATRWEEIGEALGLKPGVLDNIRSNTVGSSNQQERCLREVFKKWYNGMISDFSWKMIVEVLDSLDEHRVVEGLYRKLIEN